MENKLKIIGQSNLMDNFVKTDDLLKDMCGIIESSREAAYKAVNVALVAEKLAFRISNCQRRNAGRRKS